MQSTREITFCPSIHFYQENNQTTNEFQVSVVPSHLSFPVLKWNKKRSSHFCSISKAASCRKTNANILSQYYSYQVPHYTNDLQASITLHPPSYIISLTPNQSHCDLNVICRIPCYLSVGGKGQNLWELLHKPKEYTSIGNIERLLQSLFTNSTLIARLPWTTLCASSSQ